MPAHRDLELLRVGGIHFEAEIAVIGERLLALYRGAFLENEEPQRWMLAARDRWRERGSTSTDGADLYESGRLWP